MTALQLFIVVLCSSIQAPPKIKKMCEKTMTRCVRQELKSKRAQSQALMKCGNLYVAPFQKKGI